jgi:uncharacterized protein
MKSHVETVRSIYAAFGRQDFAAILEPLAEDIEWEYAYPDRGVPWLLPRNGRKAVPGFFEALGTCLDMNKFDVKAVMGDGRLVVAILDVDFTVKSTGKRIVETDEGHLWAFDDRGRVVRFRHLADTLLHHEAFRPA